MEIQNLAERKKENSFIRALVYGEAGTKKTTLIGTFPKPIWIADFDGKLDILYGQEGIEYTTYAPKKIEDCKDVFTQFKRDWAEVQKDDKYKTIAIDGITALDILIIRACVILSGKVANATPTLPIYGDQASFYNYFFKYSVNSIIDRNVIITAHEFYNIDENSGVHSIYPLITGNKLLPKLPGMFKETWHMVKEGGHTGKVTLHYEKSNKAVATSLLLHGKGSIEDPTYEKIMNEMVEGSKV